MTDLETQTLITAILDTCHGLRPGRVTEAIHVEVLADLGRLASHISRGIVLAGMGLPIPRTRIAEEALNLCVSASDLLLSLDRDARNPAVPGSMASRERDASLFAQTVSRPDLDIRPAEVLIQISESLTRMTGGTAAALRPAPEIVRAHAAIVITSCLLLIRDHAPELTEEDLIEKARERNDIRAALQDALLEAARHLAEESPDGP